MDDRARQVCAGCGAPTRLGRFCDRCLTWLAEPVIGAFVPCEACGGSGERLSAVAYSGRQPPDEVAVPCAECEGFGSVWVEGESQVDESEAR